MTGRDGRSGPRRIVSVAAALLLALTVGACATYSGARYGGPDAPLQARLASTHGVHAPLNFAVSDGAHVALFRIHDSGYVRALYPYHPGSSSLLRPGAHAVLTSSFGSYRRGWGWGLATRPGPASLHSSAGCFGRVTTSYLMIVASRRPLELSRIRGEVPFRYSSVSALATPFRMGTAFGSMDHLMERLIPEGTPREDWDVDWMVDADFGARCRPWHRLPLKRRLLADTDQPPAQDTTGGDTRRRRLDTGDLPFSPPGVPVDLPEVTVDGRDGSGRIRVPLPPVAVTPVPDTPPEGKRRGAAVEGFDEDRPGRRPHRQGPGSVDDGPSDHFGRLFDDDDRRDAAAWIPGWTGDRGRAADRRMREWTRDLNEWASNPDGYAFPDPPRPPARWRDRNVDWPSSGSIPRGRPGDRDRLRDFGDVQRIDPPDRSRRGRDIELRRPPSPPDRGGDSEVRKSGGGSEDRGGH